MTLKEAKEARQKISEAADLLNQLIHEAYPDVRVSIRVDGSVVDNPRGKISSLWFSCDPAMLSE